MVQYKKGTEKALFCYAEYGAVFVSSRQYRLRPAKAGRCCFFLCHCRGPGLCIISQRYGL